MCVRTRPRRHPAARRSDRNAARHADTVAARSGDPKVLPHGSEHRVHFRCVFERAQGGTLLLDEVTEMPLDMQTRLLRVLETRKFYRMGASTEFISDVCSNAPKEAPCCSTK